MCAGVQNVSRPMLRCQEMSQIVPTTMLVVARAAMGMIQGTAADVAGDVFSSCSPLTETVAMRGPLLQYVLADDIRCRAAPSGEYSARDGRCRCSGERLLQQSSDGAVLVHRPEADAQMARHVPVAAAPHIDVLGLQPPLDDIRLAAGV